MSNPAPTLNQIDAFNATQGTTIDFNIIGGTEVIRSNKIYIYDLSDNSLICTHLYVSTESIHELPANTDSSIVYESGKSSADFVNGAQYYAQIQTYTDTAGTQGGSGLSVAKMFWCLVDPTLTITTIPSTISTTSYNVSATYTDTSASVVSNIIQQYQFSLYSATGSLLQSSGVVVGSGEQQGTSTAYDISYNFTGLSVGSSYYVVVDVTTTQGMSVSAQSGTFTVSIDTPTLGEATVVNNACDGYISVTSNLSSEYGGSASGEIATFETDSVNDVSSLKVTLTPQQSATPWIGTDHDTTPYLNRAMPTQSNAYNRESGVLVGGTVAWNQLAAERSASDTSRGITKSAAVNGKVTVSGTRESAGWLGVVILYDYVANHKMLVVASNLVVGSNTTSVQYLALLNHYTQVCALTTAKNYALFTNSSDTDISFSIGGRVGDVYDYSFIPQIFDLTAMFGSTIADYIYSLEQATAGAGVAWFRKYFPEDYYPYSANTLQSVQATAHKTYDGGGNVIGNYALDSSLTLRGIPKLDASNNLYYDGDEYESDGTVTRKYISHTFDGTESLMKLNTGTSGWYEYAFTPTPTTPNGQIINFVTDYGEAVNTFDTNNITKVIVRHYGTGFRWSMNVDTVEAAKSALIGKTLVYELATPTTETAQAYTNPQVVDPDGTEEYVTANSVPVGHDSTYSLVCPISGYDSVSANVVGKNWLDESLLLDQSGWNNIRIYAPVGTVLTASTNIPNGSNLLVYFNDGGGGGTSADVVRDGVVVTKTVPSQGYLILSQRRSSGSDSFANYETQIELGSTATDYEPYQGQTYTVDLPETVYGGTVDLVSGEVVIDRAMIVLDGSETNWAVHTYGSNNIISFKRSVTNFKATTASQQNAITDKFEWRAFAWSYQSIYGIFGASDTTVYFRPPSEDITTLAQWTEWLSNNPTQIVYELATPQTIQLTPQEIQTLVGTNNVWSEDGDVEITYNIPITNLLVKRQDVADVSGTWLTLYSQPVTQASDMDFTFIDFLNQYGKTYKYALVPLLTQTQSGVVVQIEGGYTVSDNVDSIFDGVYIADQTNVERVKAGVGYGNIDMNQGVGSITPIGSKYPIVITNSQNQYHNGSVRGTIVPNDFYSNGNLSRIDMVNKRDELEQFLTNKRAKIIKDWNGNIWLVMIMSNVNCSFDDNYGMGMVSFSADWLEVGDPTNQQDLYNAGLINVGGV